MSSESQTTITKETSKPAGTGTGPVETKSKSSWIAWLIALAVLGVGGYYLVKSLQSTKTDSATAPGGKKGRGAGGPVPVSAEKTTRGDMGVYVTDILGTVTPVYTVSINSRVAGELMQVSYREGQMVHKGDLLAVVDPRPYDAALLQAQGQLQRDQALLENAKVDLTRYQAAFQQHAIPEQTLATQQATVNQDDGTVKLDQGNVDAAKVNVDYTKITSPIDGRVGLRLVDPGNIVPANGTTPLLTITQLTPITIMFPMAEDHIAEVVAQMRAGNTLQVEAFDRSNSKLVGTGRVLTLDNSVDTGSGTVRVRCQFPNADLRLFPNEFVNGRILVRTIKDATIIPTAALQRNNDTSYVYTIGPDKNDPTKTAVTSQTVTVQTTNGTQAAVSGVEAGATVVTDGFDKLQDGSRVVARQGPRNPAAAVAAATAQGNGGNGHQGGGHKGQQQ